MVKDVMFGKTMRKSYAKYEEILQIPNMSILSQVWAVVKCDYLQTNNCSTRIITKTVNYTHSKERL